MIQPVKLDSPTLSRDPSPVDPGQGKFSSMLKSLVEPSDSQAASQAPPPRETATSQLRREKPRESPSAEEGTQPRPGPQESEQASGEPPAVPQEEQTPTKPSKPAPVQELPSRESTGASPETPEPPQTQAALAVKVPPPQIPKDFPKPGQAKMTQEDPLPDTKTPPSPEASIPQAPTALVLAATQAVPPPPIPTPPQEGPGKVAPKGTPKTAAPEAASLASQITDAQALALLQASGEFPQALSAPTAGNAPLPQAPPTETESEAPAAAPANPQPVAAPLAAGLIPQPAPIKVAQKLLPQAAAQASVQTGDPEGSEVVKNENNKQLIKKSPSATLTESAKDPLQLSPKANSTQETPSLQNAEAALGLKAPSPKAALTELLSRPMPAMETPSVVQTIQEAKVGNPSAPTLAPMELPGVVSSKGSDHFQGRESTNGREIQGLAPSNPTSNPGPTFTLEASTPAIAKAAPAEASATRPSLPMEQMEGTVRWVLKNQQNSAELQLRPDSLGKVQIQIKVEGNQVHAKVWASEPSTIPLLENHRGMLESSLREQGLSLGSFDLHQGQGSPRHALDQGSGQAAFAGPALDLSREPLVETPVISTPSTFGNRRVEVFA